MGPPPTYPSPQQLPPPPPAPVPTPSNSTSYSYNQYGQYPQPSPQYHYAQQQQQQQQQKQQNQSQADTQSEYRSESPYEVTPDDLSAYHVNTEWYPPMRTRIDPGQYTYVPNSSSVTGYAPPQVQLQQHMLPNFAPRHPPNAISTQLASDAMPDPVIPTTAGGTMDFTDIGPPRQAPRPMSSGRPQSSSRDDPSRAEVSTLLSATHQQSATSPGPVHSLPPAVTLAGPGVMHHSPPHAASNLSGLQQQQQSPHPHPHPAPPTAASASNTQLPSVNPAVVNPQSISKAPPIDRSALFHSNSTRSNANRPSMNNQAAPPPVSGDAPSQPSTSAQSAGAPKPKDRPKTQQAPAKVVNNKGTRKGGRAYPGSTEAERDDTAVHCPTCGKNVRSPPALRWHMRTHEGSRPFQCTLCSDYAGPTRHALHQHIYKHHREQNPNARSTKAGSNKKRSAAPIRPESPDSDGPPDSADELQEDQGTTGTISSAGSTLPEAQVDTQAYGSDMVERGPPLPPSPAPPRKKPRKSTKTRDSEESSRGSVICPVCFRPVRSPPALKWHMRIHSGSRPYVCQMCDKYAGTTRHALSQHVYKAHRRIAKLEQKDSNGNNHLSTSPQAVAQAPTHQAPTDLSSQVPPAHTPYPAPAINQAHQPAPQPYAAIPTMLAPPPPASLYHSGGATGPSGQLPPVQPSVPPPSVLLHGINGSETPSQLVRPSAINSAHPPPHNSHSRAPLPPER